MSEPFNPKSGKMIVNPGRGGDAFTAESNQSRMLPRQMSIGTLRGTQNVGYGGVKIDSSNNRITIGGTVNGAPESLVLGKYVINGQEGFGLTVTNSDSSVVGIGLIPGTTQLGFFSTDTAGNLIMKIVLGTKFTYNPTDNFVNVMQDGLLPDGSAGWAVAAPGLNVDDGF